MLQSVTSEPITSILNLLAIFTFVIARAQSLLTKLLKSKIQSKTLISEICLLFVLCLQLFLN